MKRDGKKVLIYNIPIQQQMELLKVLSNIKILDKSFCSYKELNVYERENEISVNDVFDIGILNVTDLDCETLENIIEHDISRMFCLYYTKSDNIDYLNENVKYKVLDSLENTDDIRDAIVTNIKLCNHKCVVNEESIGVANFARLLNEKIENLSEEKGYSEE